MSWINIYGIAFIIVLMVPNYIFSIKCPESFVNKFDNKLLEIFEQIGRFGSIGFMIINIPQLTFRLNMGRLLYIYLIVNSVLIIIYLIVWIVYKSNVSIFRSLSLSIIPSLIFIFSGVITLSVPLLISSLIFAPSHIIISYINTKQGE